MDEKELIQIRKEMVLAYIRGLSSQENTEITSFNHLLHYILTGEEKWNNDDE